MNDQPMLIVKLSQAREYVQLVLKFSTERFLEFSFVDVMNMHFFRGVN